MRPASHTARDATSYTNCPVRRCVPGLRRVSSFAATPDECGALRKHGHRAEAQKCYESLTASRDPYLRAEGYWGAQAYQEANNQFFASPLKPTRPRTS